jgi:hypothetical protein
MEKKTIEEAAECYLNNNDQNPFTAIRDSFKAGAEWYAKTQSEQMYSEEDMIEFAQWVYFKIGSNKGKVRTNNELLEQFKKS